MFDSSNQGKTSKDKHIRWELLGRVFEVIIHINHIKLRLSSSSKERRIINNKFLTDVSKILQMN